MKLESLNLEKFKDCSLKKRQMFALNGGGERTDPGVNHCGEQGGEPCVFDYSYDSVRSDGRHTFHGRSNFRYGICP